VVSGSPRPSGAVSIKALPISLIRTDARTQQRFAIDAMTVARYAALIKDGFAFPPIRVWCDNGEYWLSDGLHRLEAARSAGMAEIGCEIRDGSLSEARWDSYAGNAADGRVRTPEETRRVIEAALEHANSARLSNVEIARHLHVTEATIRRWRSKGDGGGDDMTRLVRRGMTTYSMTTTNLGKRQKRGRPKSRRRLRRELATMKEHTSNNLHRLLVIFEHWAFGQASHRDCLEAMRRVMND